MTMGSNLSALVVKYPRSYGLSQAFLSITGLIFLSVFFLGFGGNFASAAPLQDQQVISVPINKSRVLDLRDPISRVSVANPAIADILIIKPTQVYVNGKELGSTNMILWDLQDQVQRQISLEVTQDLEALKEKIYRLLPGERIRVEAAQGSVVLSGTASSPERMESAVKIAKTFAGEKVISLLNVGGAQQVLLAVKVAEVRRELGKTLDTNMLALYNGGSVKIGLVKGGITGDRNIKISDNIPISSTTNIFERLDIADAGLLGNVASGNFLLDFAMDLAESQGLVRILAEPNLTTLSGQEAQFLSGGQFPYQVIGDNGIPGTEWKDYGIKLMFLPFVLDSGKISLKVNVSVSELGPVVPTTSGDAVSVLTRGANATVEIPGGETIAIAGLLSENARDGVDKFPGLGDIPILGALFRSQEFRKDQTELVIFVTPRLANSFEGKNAKLPTDGFVEPNDVDFYLMGKTASKRKESSSSSSRSSSAGKQSPSPDKQGSEGVFGHDL